MQIREIMRKPPNVITCNPADYVVEAARKMKEQNVGCILITEQNSLKGILTDRDITLSVVAQGKDPKNIKISDVMKTNVFSGKPEWDIYETTRFMSEKKIRRLPIQTNGRLEGFISLADLAPVLRKEIDSVLELEATPVSH